MTSSETASDPVQKKRSEFYKKIGVVTGPLTESHSEKLSKELAPVARKEFSKLAKLDEQTHKEEVTAAKLAVLYYDRLTRSQEALTFLEQYCPPAEKLTKSFREVHEAAEKKVQEGKAKPPVDWSAATKILHNVHLSNAVEDARKLWNSAADDLKKKHPEIMEWCEKIEQAMTSSKVLTLEFRNSYRARMISATKPTMVAKPANDTLLAAGLTLTDLYQSIQRGIKDAEVKQQQALKLTDQAAELLEQIAPEKPSDELPLLTNKEAAGLRRLLMSAGSADATRDYDAEIILLKELIDEAKDLETQRKPLRTEWLTIADTLKIQIVAAKELISATSPEVREEAAELVRRLTQIHELRPGIGIEFDKAIERVKAAPRDVIDLKENEKAFISFTAERKLADARIEALVKEVLEEFGKLHTAMYAVTEGEHSDLADAGFRSELAQIVKDWEERVQVAADVSSLNEAGAVTQLTTLKDAIDRAASDSVRLTALINDGALHDARMVYISVRDQAIKAAEELAGLDGVAGGRLLAAMEKEDTKAMKATTPGAFDGPNQMMTLLEKQAREAADKQNQKVFFLQEELKRRLSPIPAELAQLLEAANKLKNAEKQKPHLAMHTTLQSAFDSLRSMQGLRQVPLLESSIDEAADLQKDLQAALLAVSGKKDSGGEKPVTFEDIRKTLNELRQILANEDVQIYARVTAFELEEKAKELESELGTTTISALTKDVATLGEAVGRCRQQAVDAKKIVGTFETDLKKLSAKLENTAFRDAPAFVKAVTAKIQSILGDARFEGGLKSAKQAALKLSSELDDVLKGPMDDRGVPVALAEQEISAVESRHQAELDKSKFSGEVTVLEKQLNSLKHLNSREIGSLESTLSDTKKAADKSGDYSTGREQLQSIRTRLALVSANPRGLAITVRKRLPSVLVRVKKAMTTLIQAIGEVGSEVTKLDPSDLDDDGKILVGKQLAQVTGLFNPAAFNKSVATVAKEGLDDRERSAAREVALRDLRRMSAYLYEDYRLQALVDTPFRKGMASVISEMNLAFLDLENNLLISM